jgi:hypothetical protein
MANKLYKFKCMNLACTDRDNFVEVPDGEPRTTKYLLYCGTCGVCVTTKKEVEMDNFGSAWLPCIMYEGPGKDMTTGPVPDEKLGYRWGAPSGGNLTEEEFMKQHGINPRVEWCKRKTMAHPTYKVICKEKGKIEPVKNFVVPPKIDPRPPRPKPTW